MALRAINAEKLFTKEIHQVTNPDGSEGNRTIFIKEALFKQTDKGFKLVKLGFCNRIYPETGNTLGQLIIPNEKTQVFNEIIDAEDRNVKFRKIKALYLFRKYLNKGNDSGQN